MAETGKNLAAAASAAVQRQAEQQGEKPSLQALLNAEWVMKEVARQLGGSESEANAFIRSVISAVKNAPDLARCDPQTVFGGMFMAAQLHLEVGSGLGQAYLIPRQNRNSSYGWEASFQIGYPGLIKLATNSGQVLGVDTVVVRKGDRFRKGANSERGKFFDVAFGDDVDDTDPTLIERVIGLVYVRGLDKPIWRDLSRAQVEARRPESTKQRTGANGTYTPNTPWKSDWGPMAEKTAVIEVLKYVAKAPTLALAMAADDQTVHSSERSQEMTIHRTEGGTPQTVAQAIQTQAAPATPAPAPQTPPPAAQPPQEPSPQGEPTPPPPEPEDDYDAPPEEFWGRGEDSGFWERPAQ